jgi:DNA-directed RNA polymerase specialized sigma24 family protein
MIARELEGVPDREIAQRFEISVTAVRVRMHRARRKIRVRFQEERP